MFAPRGWLKRPGARRIYRAIEDSGQFNRSWYRHTQRHGVARWSDPLWHYLDHGAAAGLDPSPVFDTSHYIDDNHDVRISKINPLFHFGQYGLTERRSPVRSIRQTHDVLFPEAKELQTFLSPRIGESRLTVLLDQASRSRDDVSLTALIESAGKLATKDSRLLRVISYLEDDSEFRSAMTSALEKVVGDPTRVSVVLAKSTMPATTFDVHEDELFLATSWTSALALRHTAPHHQLHVIAVQEPTTSSVKVSPYDEVEVEKWGASLARSGHRPLAETLSRTAKEPWLPTPAGSISVSICADASFYGDEYLQALLALEALLLGNPDLKDSLFLSLWGTGLEPLALAEDIIPEVRSDIPNSAWESTDVIIMAAPFIYTAKEAGERGIRVLDATRGGLSDSMTTEPFQELSQENLEELIRHLALKNGGGRS